MESTKRFYVRAGHIEMQLAFFDLVHQLFVSCILPPRPLLIGRLPFDKPLICSRSYPLHLFYLQSIFVGFSRFVDGRKRKRLPRTNVTIIILHVEIDKNRKRNEWNIKLKILRNEESQNKII